MPKKNGHIAALHGSESIKYPACLLGGVVPGLGRGSVDLTEEAVAAACFQYGRVLDARVDGEDVRVYFESDAAALRCYWELHDVYGVLPSRRETENIDFVEVEVSIKNGPSRETEVRLGRQCAQFGRVIEAASTKESVRLAMATETGAAASVICLENDVEGVVSARLRLNAQTDSSPPMTILPMSISFDLEDIKERGQRYGEILDVIRSTHEDTIIIQFKTSTQAARCCAEIGESSAQFCVRGGSSQRLDASFATEVIATLPKPLTRLEKGIRALRSEIDAIPRNYEAYALLAGALLRLDLNTFAEEALDNAQIAIELAPKFAWGHFRKGSALLAMGHIAKAATSLALASSLAPENSQFTRAASQAKQAAEKILDPLDAFVATQVQAEAAEQLIYAADSQRQAIHDHDTKRRKLSLNEKDTLVDDDSLLDYNPRARCYICKQTGHTKRDCPLAKCQYCNQVGHKKSECPLFTTALADAEEKEKKQKRKAFYEKKKLKRKEEWTKHLREQTGIEGFAALYRVLGLPERRLASSADIRKAYHRRSLEFHPDKHPHNREEAHERFLEIRSAYELLIEGMESGGINGHAVFSAGEITDAAAAQALQDKVKVLADKVNSSRAWSG